MKKHLKIKPHSRIVISVIYFVTTQSLETAPEKWPIAFAKFLQVNFWRLNLETNLCGTRFTAVGLIGAGQTKFGCQTPHRMNLFRRSPATTSRAKSVAL